MVLGCFLLLQEGKQGKALHRWIWPITSPCTELAREEQTQWGWDKCPPPSASAEAAGVGGRCHWAAGAAKRQGSRDPDGWCKRTSACDLGTGNGAGIG